MFPQRPWKSTRQCDLHDPQGDMFTNTDFGLKTVVFNSSMPFAKSFRQILDTGPSPPHNPGYSGRVGSDVCKACQGRSR